MRHSPEYTIWCDIKTRCYNEKHEAYKDYGGRGITMSDDWKESFESFFRDMGSRPSANHSIDRRDNDKGYSKENCHWATRVEQVNNTRSNLYFDFDGERKTLANWCRELGLNYNTIYNRIWRGMSFEDSIYLSEYRLEVTMKSILTAIMAIALLFGSAFPAFAENNPTKTAVVQMLSQELLDDRVSKSDIVRIVNASFAEAKKHRLDPFLIISLINTESKFRAWAKNKSGARGLMQVIPRWHREKIKGRNIMNIETNIEVGTQILADCLENNKGYIKKALHCYSGGARNYAMKLKAGHTQYRMADVLYRFENQLPLDVEAQFDRPRHYHYTREPILAITEREQSLLAIIGTTPSF